MIYAYVDESERDEDFYFLGALVCTEAQSRVIDAGLTDILKKHISPDSKISLETEFHGYCLMNQCEDWTDFGLRRSVGVFKDVMSVVAASGACMHIEGVDVARQVARYSTPTPARELAFSHLFERINDCASRRRERVRVIADDHHTKEISRSNFRSYRVRGTYGYRSSTLQEIEPKIEFIDSRTSRPMQAADLVTYLYNRIRTVPCLDPREQKTRELLWQAALPAVGRGSQRIWP